MNVKFKKKITLQQRNRIDKSKCIRQIRERGTCFRTVVNKYWLSSLDSSITTLHFICSKNCIILRASDIWHVNVHCSVFFCNCDGWETQIELWRIITQISTLLWLNTVKRKASQKTGKRVYGYSVCAYLCTWKQHTRVYRFVYA